VVDVRSTPRVAVIVATHNRCGVLKLALQSLIDQSYRDWEAIVVGDACTDDTEDVVAALGDSRIRFVDLTTNFGEQSGPNNVGVARTTAPLVAFLNHDDLWFPDHLAIAVDTLDARAADLVFSPNITIHPVNGSHEARHAPLGVTVDSLARDGRYDPRQIDRATPATSWLLSRKLHEALSGWRAASECRIEPSQDFLLRAWRGGHRLWSTGVATVVTIASGTRADSYVSAATGEHEWLHQRLAQPGFRARLLALDSEASGARRNPRPLATRAWHRVLATFSRLGIAPRVLDAVLRRRLARGGRIDELRRVRGLTPIIRATDTAADVRRAEVLRVCAVEPGALVEFCRSGDGHRYLACGWSAPEPWGVWSEGSRAELAFALDAERAGPTACVAHLRVVARIDPRRKRQRVGIKAARWHEDRVLDDRAEHVLRVPLELRAGRPSIIELVLPDAFAADGDPRVLALGLISARVEPA